MKKFKHLVNKNSEIVVTDTIRSIDGDGFILDISDAEMAKLIQMPDEWTVIESAPVKAEPKPEAKEDSAIAEVKAPIEQPKVMAQKHDIGKRGRPTLKR